MGGEKTQPPSRVDDCDFRIPRFSKDLNLWKVSHPPPPSAPWTSGHGVTVGRFAVDFLLDDLDDDEGFQCKSPKW